MALKTNVKRDHGTALPIIDVDLFKNGSQAQRKQIAELMVAACEDYGFFYISNHGIAADHIKNAFAQSKRFFAQPLEFKSQYSIEKSDRFQGYEPQTDLESKEAYVLGPERSMTDPLVQQGVKYHGANIWPDLTGWRETMLEQMSQMLSLAKTMNTMLATGLKIDPLTLDRISLDPMCALRLLHYPPGDARAGIESHTDWGALSLLIQDATEGLEILMPDGQWHVVPPLADTLVVNIGEMVEIWTGGRLKATPHRVVNRSQRDRYSIAFFLDMDHDATLEPVVKSDNSKYKPIKVADFIDQMHKRDYGGKNA